MRQEQSRHHGRQQLGTETAMRQNNDDFDMQSHFSIILAG